MTIGNETQEARSARLARDKRVGLPPRRAAVALLHEVLERRRAFDDAFAQQAGSGLLSRLTVRDRALARAIAATALRRLGQIDAIFETFLEKPLQGRTGLLKPVMRAALAEILFMDAPAHAVVNLAVHQLRDDPASRKFSGLANAILRRASEQGERLLAQQDAARMNTPDWLWESWEAAHGAACARRIAQANLSEAPLDISVREDAAGWAARLGGEVVGAQTVRLARKGRVEELPGFESGAWWVQDAAAALPARLLGDVKGKRVADLCAAPGGKTAQLAAAGAQVTAVDIAAKRLRRLADNLDRLALDAELIEADAGSYVPAEPFDAVLLDAPCSATGTIRRHPDIPHLKAPEDVARLARLQRRLLAHACTLVKPGGVLIYCTCSLQGEEGEAQLEALLQEGAGLLIDPVRPEEAAGIAHSISARGWLRTWPFETAGEAGVAADGFFVARLRMAAAGAAPGHG
ncbi:MAG: transcription antitermination factor NusB [Methyloligellaceae bacterium]